MDEATFRAEARAWLDKHAPAFAGGDREDWERSRAWQRELAEGGWGAPLWPVEHGGRALSPSSALAFAEEASGYELPANPFLIGLGLVGPTLAVHGTVAQQQRWMRKILTAAQVWCQLWSEPNAGSDLASLRTRADRVPGGFVLNGQKVWTSQAHHADFGICVARTDLDVPKHRGITCFAVPMRAPGVTVRPLRQITGEAEFNEVFLDDVLVPDENVIGEVNDGWRVAITVLMNERHAVVGDRRGVTARDLLLLVAGTTDAVVRDEAMRVWIQSKVLDLVGARTRAKTKAGEAPGPEGSIGKSMRARLSADLARVALGVQGAGGMLAGGKWAHAFMRAPAQRIAGGTDEIQRNIIGERVLGLPKEPAVDRDVPFRELLAKR